MKRQEERNTVRKSGILGRDSLSERDRTEFSSVIAEKIAASDEFKRAGTILIYKGVKGEVHLEKLERIAEAEGKKTAFPLCISKSEMIALVPCGTDCWKKGACGIMEPIREASAEISPEEIDLVICPCTAFDDSCNRMGMGGGYYDRYLPWCTNADIAAAAFEGQKVTQVPVESHDRPMDKVFTEKQVYCRRRD